MHRTEVWGNTREIMQHVLKMQSVSLLIQHKKGISRGAFTMQLSATSSSYNLHY
jgi:hypothetical protein